MDRQQVNNRCQKTSTLMKHSLTAPPIVCDKCKNTYAIKKSLSNHKRICNGPKVCDNCNETFTSSQGLSNHKRWKCSQHPIVSAAGVDLPQQKVESINKRQQKQVEMVTIQLIRF